MIIALAGQKGGVGKTTVAISLAVEWQARGRRVLLVDLDPQATTRTWGDVAAEHCAPAPPVVSMGTGFYQHLPTLAADHEVTLVDCPPHQGELQRAALMIADLALMPCGPSGPDGWALSESAGLVRRAQTEAGAVGLKAAVLITRRVPRTVLGRGAREALSGSGFPVLASELAYRIGYQESLTAGLGPTTYEPESEAASEVRALATELEALLGLPALAPTRKARGRKKAST